ncbi:MAG TPA: hypothetical protein VIU42_17395 [Xanthobacteraceae bacterium]
MAQTNKRRLSGRCSCCIEPLSVAGVSRRQMLAGIVAAAAGTAAGFAPQAFAQTSSTEKPFGSTPIITCPRLDLLRKLPAVAPARHR